VIAEGPDRILVTLPVDADPEPVRGLLGRAGVVKFVPIADEEPVPEHGTRVVGPSLLTGADVVSAAVGVDERGQRAINIQLGPEGAETLHEHMRAHLGSYFALTVDDVALSVPQIVEPIPDGRVQITTPGGMDLVVAEELEMFLESGPLPFPLQPVPAGG
jgi:preprotein translocase subunit SecD